jgi:DNA-binding NarL/FixJ family response regulator
MEVQRVVRKSWQTSHAGYAPTPRRKMGKIRVLDVSNYQIVRSGLRQLPKSDEASDVLLADAEIGKALPRLCQTLLPDVLLMALAANSPSNPHVLVSVLAVVPRVRF